MSARAVLAVKTAFVLLLTLVAAAVMHAAAANLDAQLAGHLVGTAG